MSFYGALCHLLAGLHFVGVASGHSLGAAFPFANDFAEVMLERADMWVARARE